jgi:hypothetical protein
MTMTAPIAAAKRLQSAASTGFFGHYSNDVAVVADAILAPSPAEATPAFSFGDSVKCINAEYSGSPPHLTLNAIYTVLDCRGVQGAQDEIRLKEVPAGGWFRVDRFAPAPAPDLPAQTTPLVSRCGKYRQRDGGVATVISVGDGEGGNVVDGKDAHGCGLSWFDNGRRNLAVETVVDLVAYLAPLDAPAVEPEPAKPHSAEVVDFAKQMYLAVLAGGGDPDDKCCLQSAEAFYAAAKENAK